MADYIVTQTTDPGQATICTNASVGIGTTSPIQTLTVVGVVRTYDTGGNNLRSDHFVGVTDKSAHLNAYDDTHGAYIPLILDGNPILMNTGSNGRVGIGTTSPAATSMVNAVSSQNVVIKADSTLGSSAGVALQGNAMSGGTGVQGNQTMSALELHRRALNCT